jgi:hypothetical protein
LAEILAIVPPSQKATARKHYNLTPHEGEAMLYKSSLLSQASGSLDGTVFSHNRGGRYTRRRAIPTNPQTGLQTTVRNALAVLSAGWASLSTANKALWNEYAANVAMTNRLGDTIYLTGQQHYIRSNVPRIQIGEAPISAGPTTYNLGDFTLPTFIAVTGPPLKIDVTIEPLDDWACETGSFMIIQQGLTQSPGCNFFKAPFRLLGHIDGDDLGGIVNPTTFSTPVFTLTAGNKTWLRARVSRLDGRLSAPILIGPEFIT